MSTNGNFEIDRFLQAGSDALTDNITERLATTASNGLEVVDKLNDPDTKAAVLQLLDNLRDLHRSGALTSLSEVVDKTANQKFEGGILSTISMLGKPEAQKACNCCLILLLVCVNNVKSFNL